MTKTIANINLIDAADQFDRDHRPAERKAAQAPVELLRVLVADDDAMFCELVVSSLATSSISTKTVFDGAAAMGALMEDSFDLAIVDLSMPQIDGFRLIALIRATPKLRDLPIMIVTARQDAEARDEGFRVGADDYLTKPVNWAQLPDRINRLCARRAA